MECFECGKLFKNKKSELFDLFKSGFDKGELIIPDTSYLNNFDIEYYLFEIKYPEPKEVKIEEVTLKDKVFRVLIIYEVTHWKFTVNLIDMPHLTSNKETYLYTKNNNPLELIGHIITFKNDVKGNYMTKFGIDWNESFIKINKKVCEGCGR